MSDAITDLRSLNHARAHAFVLPREHGAWGILLVPFITGAAVAILRGGSVPPVLVFLLAAVSLFCLRTPVEALLGISVQRAETAGERRLVSAAAASYAALGLTLISLLLWQWDRPALMVVGAIAALSLIVQAGLRQLGRRTRMLSQMVGLVGLTSTGAGAYYVSTGRLDLTACMIWAANWLFAANQVHMVQLRIHHAKVEGLARRLAQGWKFLAGEIATVIVLLLFFYFHLLPKMSVIAFHPMLLRGAAWFFKKPRPLRVRRLGWTELGFAMIFGVMFISGYLR